MIFDLMAHHGYSAFAPNAGFRGRLAGYGRRRLALSPLAAPMDDDRFQYDVVFARSDFST